MRELLRVFPVKSVVLIKEAVGDDICPQCADSLDRSKVCMGCGADWHKHVPARYKWSVPEPVDA
jgi:predicted amidophosphoribosyltransferase